MMTRTTLFLPASLVVAVVIMVTRTTLFLPASLVVAVMIMVTRMTMMNLLPHSGDDGHDDDGDDDCHLRQV